MSERRYDELVVGSGSAGSALAARLSEDPDRRVGLIEAGPYYPTAEDHPVDLLNGNAMSLAAHDWGLTARVFEGRTIRFPQGKVVGGSSAVGVTIALRGMPGDYDEWAAVGNPEWAWDCVLPYLRAVESDLDFHDDLHGCNGPIPIRRWRPEELTAVQQAFLESCLDAGYPYTADQNHPDSTGVGPIPSNRRDPKTRVSAAIGYLAPARDRPNLTVHQRALVARVLVRDDRAVGVELLAADGTSEQVFADRVILAAGAFQSPAILMRSGIGAADDLRALGLDVVADLPGVGAGLIDHPRSGVFMTPRPGSQDTGAPLGQIMVRTTSSTGGETNDMQYYGVSHLNLTSQFPELLQHAQGTTVFGAMVVAQRPQSQGSVRIASTDPRTAPVVDLNYFAHAHDQKLMMEGVRTCWELANSAGMRALGDLVVSLTDRIVADDEALMDYLRVSVDSTYHPMGTARMGAPNDPGAVVDQFGAVRGLHNLYVADASIMPTMPRTNTNLTSMMIGERMAAWLRES